MHVVTGHPFPSGIPDLPLHNTAARRTANTIFHMSSSNPPTLHPVRDNFSEFVDPGHVHLARLTSRLPGLHDLDTPSTNERTPSQPNTRRLWRISTGKQPPDRSPLPLSHVDFRSNQYWCSHALLILSPFCYREEGLAMHFGRTHRVQKIQQ